MNKIIIDIFMYLFETILILYYADTLFEAKKSKAFRILFAVVVNIILCTVYQLKYVYINVILLFILYTLMFALLYNISVRTAAFHSVLFVVAMFTSEMLVMAIGSLFNNDFNAMDSDMSAYLYVIITSKLIHFGVIMAILKLFAQKESNERQTKYYWLLFVMPLASILMLLAFRYLAYQVALSRTLSVFFAVSTVVMLFANILVFVIYEYSQKNTKELYDLKTIQHQEEQDKRYFEVIEQSNKEMRLFSHDIKNHLMQIRNLEDVEDIHNYVDRLIPDLKKFSYTGISKNKMLDLIISKYITLCESKRIKFSVDVKTANLSYINDVDLSTLMNNLLDNSLEAAEKAQNGFIQINIFSKNKLYDGLVIRNSCAATPKIESGELKTTKRNFKAHGMGISSIKKIIKKYNAVYGWKYDEEKMIFETDIAFEKQKN